MQRREFLRRGGLVAALAGATGLAGCTGEIRDVVDGGGGSSGDYQQWLYDPTTVLEDADYQGFTTMNVADVHEHEDDLPEDVFDSLEDANDELTDYGVDLESLGDVTGMGYGYPNTGEGQAIVGGSMVASGEFDVDAIADGIEEANESVPEDRRLEEDGELDGHTLYTTAYEYEPYDGEAITQSAALAVSSETVVMAGMQSNDATARGAAEAMLNAGSDGAGAWTNANGDAKAVLDELGDPTTASGFVWDQDLSDLVRGSVDDSVTDVLSDLVAAGQGSQLQGETVESRYVLVYEEADDASKEAVEAFVEYARDENEAFERFEDPTYEQNGRTVVVTVTAETEALFETSSMGVRETSDGGRYTTTADYGTTGGYETTQAAPTVSFAFQRLADDRVRIAHDGGDTVDSRLTVRYQHDGSYLAQAWSPPVSAGDTTTTENPVDDASQVFVIHDATSTVVGYHSVD